MIHSSRRRANNGKASRWRPSRGNIMISRERLIEVQAPPRQRSHYEIGTVDLLRRCEYGSDEPCTRSGRLQRGEIKGAEESRVSRRTPENARRIPRAKKRHCRESKSAPGISRWWVGVREGGGLNRLVILNGFKTEFHRCETKIKHFCRLIGICSKF